MNGDINIMQLLENKAAELLDHEQLASYERTKLVGTWIEAEVVDM